MQYEKTRKKDGRFLEKFREGEAFCVGIVEKGGMMYYQKYFCTEEEANKKFADLRNQFEGAV